MDREVVIAKIRRWQAELAEMIAELKASGKGSSDLAKVLKHREREIENDLAALTDRSHISHGDVQFEPDDVVDEIDAKVKKVREGVQKIKQLSKEKKQILKELGE